MRGFPAAQVAPHAARLLADPSARVRAAVVDICADLGVAAAEPGIGALLQDPAAPVRAGAARALAGLDDPAVGAPDRAEVRDRLIRLLDDPEAEVREAAAKALGALPGSARAESALARALDDRHRQVAVAALDGLVRLGARAPGSVPAIAERAAAPTSTVRVPALQALGAIGDEQGVGVLIAASSDEVPAVRLAATTALGAPGRRAAVVPLTARLGDTPAVAAAAASALGVIGDPSAVPALVLALRSGPVRTPPAEALARLGAAGRDALGAVAAADAGAADPEAVRAARLALGQPASPPPPFTALDEPASGRRDEAARRLVADDARRHAAALAAAFPGLGPFARREVLLGLAAAGAPEARELAAACVADENQDPDLAAIGRAIGAAAPSPDGVEVRVLGPDGEPVAGVAVVAAGAGRVGRTDADGGVRVAAPGSEPLRVEVRPLDP